MATLLRSLMAGGSGSRRGGAAVTGSSVQLVRSGSCLRRWRSASVRRSRIRRRSSPCGMGCTRTRRRAAASGNTAASCEHCHGADMAGDPVQEIPALSLDSFMTAWSGKNVKDLFDTVKRSMPKDKPGQPRDRRLRRCRRRTCCRPTDFRADRGNCRGRPSSSRHHDRAGK